MLKNLKIFVITMRALGEIKEDFRKTFQNLIKKTSVRNFDDEYFSSADLNGGSSFLT